MATGADDIAGPPSAYRAPAARSSKRLQDDAQVM